MEVSKRNRKRGIKHFSCSYVVIYDIDICYLTIMGSRVSSDYRLSVDTISVPYIDAVTLGFLRRKEKIVYPVKSGYPMKKLASQ